MPENDDIRKRLDECPWLGGDHEGVPENELKLLLPRSEEIVQESLSELKEQYIGGEKGALTQAIFECFTSRIAVPKWVRFEFARAYYSVKEFSSDSWDEHFGRPVEKGKQKAALKKRFEKAGFLHSEVFRILEEDPTLGLDDEVMVIVAEKFGIKKSLAWEYYKYYKDSDPILHEYLEGCLRTTRENFANKSR